MLLVELVLFMVELEEKLAWDLQPRKGSTEQLCVLPTPKFCSTVALKFLKEFFFPHVFPQKKSIFI